MNTVSETLSIYEMFKKQAREDIDHHRRLMTDEGIFNYANGVDALSKFEAKVSGNLMVHLFGEQLGKHLWDKFVNECGRSILKLKRKTENEMFFFILVQIRSNKTLYANC